jgi:hypothetical protein
MVKRFVAVVLGLLLVSVLPAASMAHGKAAREAEMARTVRTILTQSKDPRTVAQALSRNGARFAGYRQTTVTFVYDGKSVVPARSVSTVVGPDFQPAVTETAPAGQIRPMAGEKADLTVTMWLYEWRNSTGTFTEQAIISGHWSSTEYSWIDDPNDVIDVRWIVGDLVYLSATPYDGVQRDQHTNGIASFTVNDQIADWDLFVNFRPTSSAVYGRWTNVFVNYTHTWWGVKLSIGLGAGPNGSTGSININTDAKTWTEGTGLAIQIGSEQSRGPVTTGYPASVQ